MGTIQVNHCKMPDCSNFGVPASTTRAKDELGQHSVDSQKGAPCVGDCLALIGTLLFPAASLFAPGKQWGLHPSGRQAIRTLSRPVANDRYAAGNAWHLCIICFRNKLYRLESR